MPAAWRYGRSRNWPSTCEGAIRSRSASLPISQQPATGLSLRDLIELTKASQPEAEGRLAAAFGRIFSTDVRRSELDRPADQVYLFGHETLQEIAEEQLAHDLGRYRQGIHEWAAEYRARGWPADTPGYLLQPYGALLASVRDAERLAAAAADSARHDRMLVRTNSDGAALTEVLKTQRLLLDQTEPDLTAVSVLAVERDRLLNRNHAIPVNLPAVWARLGNVRHARELAQSMPLPAQISALAYVIVLLAPTDPDSARGLAEEAQLAAHSLKDREDRASALHRVARAAEAIATRSWNQEKLEAHKGRIGAIFQLTRRGVLAGAARALLAGPAGPAVNTAGMLLDPIDQSLALEAIAEARASIGSDHVETADRAERAAGTLTEPGSRAAFLIGMAAALAERDPARAARLAQEAVNVTADIDGRGTDFAEELAAAGLWDAAIEVARANPDPGGYQISALIEVASALVDVDSERAGRVAEEALSGVDRSRASELRMTKLAALSRILAHTDPERATLLADEVVQAARKMTDGPLTPPGFHYEGKIYLLLAVAVAVAVIDRQRAAALASEAAALASEAAALASEAAALASEAAAESVRADRAWRSPDDAIPEPDLLHAIAQALAGTGPGRAAYRTKDSGHVPGYRSRPANRTTEIVFAVLCAAKLWDSAAQAARAMEDPCRQVDALAKIAAGLATTDPREAERAAQDAEQTALSIAGPIGQSPALRGIAEATAAARLWNRAEQTAQRIARPWLRALTLAVMAHLLSAADSQRAAHLAERAEAICDRIESAVNRAVVKAHIAAVLTAAHPDRAMRLAEAAEQAADAESNAATRAVAYAGIAAAIADTDPDRAARLAQAAEESADAENDQAACPVAYANIAAILADTDPDRAARATGKAERRANAITVRRDQAQALADVAEALAEAAPRQAARLAQEAADTARADRSRPPTGHRRPVMARVAWALAVSESDLRAGLAADATAVDRSGIGLGLEANVLALLAEGLAAARQYDPAERAARATGGPNFFASVAHARIAGPLAAAGLWERAEVAAKHAGSYRGQALASMAAAAAEDDLGRASRLAREAEDAARAMSDSFWRTNALAGVAVAADAADPARAIRLAREVVKAISDGEGQPWPAGKLAGVLTSHGQQSRAERFARTLTEPGNKALAIAGITGILAAAGRYDDAIATARTLTSSPPYLAIPLARIARLLAATSERAVSLAAEAERAARAVIDRDRETILASTAAELAAPVGLPESPQDRRLRATAHRLLATALTSESWHVALPSLGAIAPDAVTAIYTKLIASWSGDHSRPPAPVVRMPIASTGAAPP